MSKPKTKLKKVIATVVEEFIEPTYIATVKCPYCDAIKRDEVFEENYTCVDTCEECNKKFKVKIPKYE